MLRETCFKFYGSINSYSPDHKNRYKYAKKVFNNIVLLPESINPKSYYDKEFHDANILCCCLPAIIWPIVSIAGCITYGATKISSCIIGSTAGSCAFLICSGSDLHKIYQYNNKRANSIPLFFLPYITPDTNPEEKPAPPTQRMQTSNG